MAVLLPLSLLGVLLVVVVLHHVSTNQPAAVKLTPVSERSLSPTMRLAIARFGELGFRQAGAPLRADLAQATLVVAMTLEHEPIYAVLLQMGWRHTHLSAEM